MSRILFVGGPLHGERIEVPDDAWDYLVPGRAEPVLSAPLGVVPDLIRYERTRWPYCVDFDEAHREIMLGPITEERPRFSAGADDPRYAYFADKMWHARAEELIPQCVVPGCAEKGRAVLVADERGRLAGRPWERGDKIRLCPEHADDVYRAFGAYGLDNLAEWLRPDARLDPFDAFDAAADSIHGREIAASRARSLRVIIT